MGIRRPIPTRRQSRALTLALLSLILATLGWGGVATPALGADNPVRAVTDVIDAIVAKDFEAVDDFVCPDGRGTLFSEFRLGESLSIPDVAVSVVTESLDVGVTGGAVVEADIDGNHAHVDIDLGLLITVDSGMLRDQLALPGRLLEGDTRSVDDIAAAAADLLARYGEGSRIVGSVEVARVGEDWLLCTSFQDLIETAPVASPSAMDGIPDG